MTTTHDALMILVAWRRGYRPQSIYKDPNDEFSQTHQPTPTQRQ
ncbi:hypothetical protein Poly24_11390 [Rosistilla carotiformis]|uniref:Uncharacterized protein n=1 Tax=Rosistilla carotiformis TaxID=2528017 RepID=A0A518JPG2_9BACT|nr:hypothetical protein Poly24_11390 [Rosistilla carotiformis]